MWISKKKHQNEITRVKNEQMWASIKQNAENRQNRDIEKLQKDVKKLKKIVREGY
jgi:hypothetical protein